jgi:hypothetical protein
MRFSLEDPEVVDFAASTVPHPFVGGEACVDKAGGGFFRPYFPDEMIALGIPLLNEDPVVRPEDADVPGDSGRDFAKDLGLLEKRIELLAWEGDDLTAVLMDSHELLRLPPPQ